MKISNMNFKKALVVCLFGAIISGCGESDLVEIHEQELDDAIQADRTPVAAPAQPDTDPAEPGTDPDQPGTDPAQPVTDVDLPTSIDISDYDLVFSDEFKGDALDESTWGTSVWSSDTVIYNQLQYYVDTTNTEEPIDSPFSFDGQNVTINATTTPEEQRANANEQAYLSGILTTKDTFNFRYGYIEARLNVESGLGLWPSLWMLAADSSGFTPEVYIFEYDGSKPDSVFHNYNYLDSEGNLRSPGQQEVQVNGFSEGFHTIGMRWTPAELLFYVNGQPSYRIIGENVPRENMYLILNLAIGGVWPGAPDATTPDPATLEIDYIRVYQARSQ